jgi:hypothetical protein
MICVEIGVEEMVGVADDSDSRALQVIGEWQACGDAGFRRSASEM